MPSTNPESYIIKKESGDKAVVILNRPKSLNALNSHLQRQLKDTLTKLLNKKSLIILKGAGNKAFSAGGDLIEANLVRLEGKLNILIELIYDINICIYLLHTTNIPTIALINGYTFGAGAGIAYFAMFKIATETTQFAMPETKIALIPNAGGTYFLNRCTGKLGYYLALTSNSLKGSDVVRAGFATHYCLNSNLEKLEEAILNTKNINDIKAVLDKICEKDIPELSLASKLTSINRCFSETIVEGIISKLNEDESDWAQKTVETLNNHSPTSLKVTLRQLQMVKDLSLEECLVMESNLTVNCYKKPDIIEGTRIVLTNKGDVPKWNPSKLEDVTEEIIESHFQPCYGAKQRQLLMDIRNNKELQ